MIKLKDLLNERMYGPNLNDKWYPAHTRDALSWTLTHNYVPIYPKTMEKVIGKIPINAFHVTGPNYLKTMKDILGKKKSISTFTKANKSSGLAKGRGVQTDSGGVIFHVEGLLLARKYMDFDSVPDRTGRRWVQQHHIFDGHHMILKSALKKAKMPTYDDWREIENKVVRKVENDPKNQDLRYSEQIELVKKRIRSYCGKTNQKIHRHHE